MEIGVSKLEKIYHSSINYGATGSGIRVCGGKIWWIWGRTMLGFDKITNDIFEHYLR